MTLPAAAADATGEVSVVVPATSANLGPGFDAVGLALDLHDQVVARVVAGPTGSDATVTLDVDGESAQDVPRDASHLVVRAMVETFSVLGVPVPGLALTCTNVIPHGRGLGSSAAAIVAGVLAARGLVPGGDAALPDDAALDLAGRIEGHPDNVAACLLGGFTLAWQEDGRFRAVRLDPDPRLTACVFQPQESLATEQARGLLPAQVPHGDAARSAGRAALLVSAMTSRPDLLLAATEDRLHQRYRAPAMPATGRLVEQLRDAGLPAVVSGAGPSVLVPLAGLAPATLDELATRAAAEGWLVRWLGIDLEGGTASVRR